MDAAKHFFQRDRVNAAGKVVLRNKPRRNEMVAFFKALAPAVTGIEARGASRHFARISRPSGDAAEPIAPRLEKPRGKRGNSDAAAAGALCEAMSRPAMRFAPGKTAGQQAAVMMAGRGRLIRDRTQLAKPIRGDPAGSGFAAARGMARIDPPRDRMQADASVPARGPAWIAGLPEREPANLAAVALANKMARIAGKPMVTNSHAAKSAPAAIGAAEGSARQGEQLNGNRAGPMPELARQRADGGID